MLHVPVEPAVMNSLPILHHQLVGLIEEERITMQRLLSVLLFQPPERPVKERDLILLLLVCLKPAKLNKVITGRYSCSSFSLKLVLGLLLFYFLESSVWYIYSYMFLYNLIDFLSLLQCFRLAFTNQRQYLYTIKNLFLAPTCFQYNYLYPPIVNFARIIMKRFVLLSSSDTKQLRLLLISTLERART